MEKTQATIKDNANVILVPKRKRNRVWEIDFMRGICVLLMILDHLAILLANYFGRSWYGFHYFKIGAGDAFTRFCYTWVNSDARDIIHPIVLFIFFSISGISCTFSRSNAKRGLQLMVVAMLYSLCSYGAQELTDFDGVLVTFGVLNFLATSILLYALVNFLCKENDIAISLASLAIIIVTLCLYFCYAPPASTPKFFAFIFPKEDFCGNETLFYSQAEVSPGDLFTMIPYSAFFFAGVLIAKVLYPVRKSLLPKLDHAWHKPISFVGRHALVVYMFHVVLLAILLALISYLFITPGSWGF